MRLLRESDSFKEKNNLTVQEWHKFYIELIVLYVHQKIAILFDLTVDIRPRKQILPKQKKLNPVTHLHCFYFYKIHS